MRSIAAFLILLFSLLRTDLSAQDKAVQYSRDFEFKEGVYLQFMDFRNNHPVPVSRILFSSNKGDKDFLKLALDRSSLTYLDEDGKETEIKSNEVWGYCSNNVIYVKHGAEFNRVSVIGSLCHFVATVPVQIGVNDPFSYNDPFYNQPRYAYSTGQYLIDVETGKVMEFNVANMEKILERDSDLHNEFMLLKKKKKRDSVFIYLRRYNERHPVFFPE